MCGALAVAALQLLWIQGIDAPSLAAESANQRTTTQVDPAVRGSITDRNGNPPLAFTMEAKALTFQPVRVRKELEEARAKSIEQGAEGDKQAPEVSDRLAEIAAGIHAKLGDTVPEKDLLQKMNSNETFTYLARSWIRRLLPRSRTSSGRSASSVRTSASTPVALWPRISSARPAGTGTVCSVSKIRWTPRSPEPMDPKRMTAVPTAL